MNFFLFIMIMKKRLFFSLCSNLFCLFYILEIYCLISFPLPLQMLNKRNKFHFLSQITFQDILNIVIAHDFKKLTSFLEYSSPFALTSKSIVLHHIFCRLNYWAIQPRMVLRQLSTLCVFLHNVSCSGLSCAPLYLTNFLCSPGHRITECPELEGTHGSH